jgi:hypothetical protein
VNDGLVPVVYRMGGGAGANEFLALRAGADQFDLEGQRTNTPFTITLEDTAGH